MTKTDSPKAILRSDYRPSDYTIDHASLHFDLKSEGTRVISHLTVRRREGAGGASPLRLDGKELKLISLSVDGAQLPPGAFKQDDESLTIDELPENFLLEIITEIDPANNTSLEGLYLSSGNFCTQCEAQGFRKITYYLDRPDVLAKFDVQITADKARYPVLLSNGNLVHSEDLGDGRHLARWQDPFPKPSYLFALVAGTLAHIEDHFITASGREVTLRIYVEAHNIERCDFAMTSLKRSMKWDEERFGLEYDLDIFMIVAVDDFNFGAMENKGLNVFNSKYILADQNTATDGDFLGIEAVVGHEYFHNWSGNRVTCRDWFQLSLKEGLTVFRDQEFSSDLNSRALKRIEDVRMLKSRQFLEDAGPMAHPIRPDSYMQIDNFYTMTVYEKGAEVVRMISTLLGKEKFRQGIDLYFERHDGHAVTCDDFVQSMEDASGCDLAQFRNWYSQAGTPKVAAQGAYDPKQKTYTLSLKQSCPPTPNQPQKPNFHIPVRMALLGPEGQNLALQSKELGLSGQSETILELRSERETFVFSEIDSPPVPSLLRGFSAPVHLNIELSDQELAFLMASESDTFNRWDASQVLAKRAIEELGQSSSGAATEAYKAAYQRLLADDSLDAELLAEAMCLPSIESVAQQHSWIDVDGIAKSRAELLSALANQNQDTLHALYRQNQEEGAFSITPHAIGMRRLKNVCLGVLSYGESESWRPLADKQFAAATTMSDRIAALALACDSQNSRRDERLGEFYEMFSGNKLVIDKWFAVQASSRSKDTVERVSALKKHEDFQLNNPNRVRSLLSTLSANTLAFHRADGRGYELLAETVMELDSINPQVAARLVSALAPWHRFDKARQALMTSQLDAILAMPKLSKNVHEIVSKSLKRRDSNQKSQQQSS